MRKSGGMGTSKEHLGSCVSCVTLEEVEERHGGGFAMHSVTKEGNKLFSMVFLWSGPVSNVAM